MQMTNDGACESSWQDLSRGTEVAGFILEGKLASGSFGTVYRARRLGRPFAIKLIPMDPRGDREVDTLRRVWRHPNVVGFHGYGFWPDEEPRFLVLALELIEGDPLDVWAQGKNPSAVELVVQVLLPLARTLGDVHEAGVVHRDLKEANILMRETDGQPVLVDFGAAGYEGAPRLTMRLPPGTAEYRSPDVVRFARAWEGEHYTAGPGDDLWALGVTLYVLLTRQLPFGDRTRPDLMLAILQENPVPPHERNPRVPPALSELCLRMLEKDAEARYVDAKALERALVEALALADVSWSVPLFPGGGRPGKRAAAAPARQDSRWRWASGLVLTAALVTASVLSTHTVQLPTSPAPPPPQQAIPRQEMAPPEVTGEVVHGAEPQKSSTPAPVANATTSEEPDMNNKSSLAATIMICVGTACAGGPQLRPPPPAPCPPGSDETFERFDIRTGEWHGALFAPFQGPVTVMSAKPGPITARNIGPWGGLPDKTMFSGELFIGKERVYGRFTEARLPSGEVVPICLEMYENADLGVLPVAGGTARNPNIVTSVSVVVVPSFK
ncbi:serine/threonine protein kinase [Archangium lipolyticum]|uniref:serine/threonine protein kinase n=1 Tax=Archangium lipolyticum TaxID=2970465 RepID=UPI00214A8633|nr:serine/threonine-protein kinase [Archangium lipolyticum]